LLEHPELELIAKCGFDHQRGFTVDLFVRDQLAESFSDSEIVGALDYLVEHGFFKSIDLEGAHHVMFDDASLKMHEGTKSAFEAMINFLRVRPDSQRG